MLLEFLQTSRALKERNLHDKSVRIETLSADIDLVNSRKEELAAIQHVTRAVHAPGSSSESGQSKVSEPSQRSRPKCARRNAMARAGFRPSYSPRLPPDAL